jgi:hypothetical protein
VRGTEYGLAGALLLSVLGCEIDATRRSDSTGAAETPAEAPVTVEGEGMQKSLPFRLAGGSYQLDWEATPMLSGGEGGCFIGTSLHSTDGRYRGQAVSAMAKGERDTGSAAIYNVPSGTFYLDSSSGCKWRITFRRM